MTTELQAMLLTALHKLSAGNLTLRDQETLADLLQQASDQQMREVIQQLGPANVRACLEWCRRGLGARVATAFSWHWQLVRRIEIASESQPEANTQAAGFLVAIRSDLTGRCQELMNELQNQPVSDDRLRHATEELQRKLTDEQRRLSGLTAEVQKLEALQSELHQAELRTQQLEEQRNRDLQAVEQLQKHADELTEMSSGSQGDPWLELFRQNWKLFGTLSPPATRENIEQELRQYPERRNAVTSLLRQLGAALAELISTRNRLETAQDAALKSSSGQI